MVRPSRGGSPLFLDETLDSFSDGTLSQGRIDNPGFEHTINPCNQDVGNTRGIERESYELIRPSYC